MASKKPKSSPAPAAVSDSRKTTDALWLFDQFMHCDPPVILNVVGIAEATGMKPNTIVKRINAMQHRYPGFGIMTRTSGPRQSSNLAVSSPKSDTASLAKKSAAKVDSTKTDKTTADPGESGEEDDGRRKTRARSRVKQVRNEGKNEDAEAHKQTRRSTVKNAASQKKITTISEEPQQTTTTKGKTVSKPFHGSDDDGADNGESRIATKKVATPKTRGGRKSAGLGDLRSPLKNPEVPAPRGRHASLKQDDGSKQNGVSTREVVDSEHNDGHGHSHGLRRISAPLNLCTKRKRSVSLDTSSSPLTPLPEVWKRYDKGQSSLMGREEVDQVHLQPSTDTHRSRKKSKPSDSVRPNTAISPEDVTMKDGLSTTQEASQAQGAVVNDLELAGTNNGLSQLIDAPGPVADQAPLKQFEHMAAKDVATSPREWQDEILAVVIAGSGNGELGGSDNQGIEPSTNPSIPHESLEATDLRSMTLNAHVQALPKDKTACNGVANAAQDLPDESRLIGAKANANGASDVDNDEPQRSERTSFFSRPLEWMIWNPNAKRAKSANGV